MAAYRPLCSAGISTVLCSSSSLIPGLSVALNLYSLGGDADSNCHTATNPHLSRIIEPVLVLGGITGLALPNQPPARYLREKWGEDEGNVQRYSVISDELIPTGLWAIGEGVSGKVVACDRDVPGLTIISIDTAQIAPFSV